MPCFRRFGFLAVAIAALLTCSCRSKTAAFPVRTYPMGQKVRMGTITYEVFETQYLTQLGIGPAARVPRNRFFLVRMSVGNGGAANVITPNLSIEDDNGNTYPELSAGDGVPQWIGYLRSIKPADSAQGNAAFDAPSRHYRLRIADETGERTAFIDIPLTFGAETPEMPTPGDPRR